MYRYRSFDVMQIADDMELRKKHNDGQGFIYNDFGYATGWDEEENNKLHRASCRWVGRMNTSTPKYFFDTFSGASSWLQTNRADKYSLCKSCKPTES